MKHSVEGERTSITVIHLIVRCIIETSLRLSF